MLGKICRQSHHLMSSMLWRNGNTPDLFNLGIVLRTQPIQESSDLCPEICYAYELLQYVLWHNVSIASLLQSESTASKPSTFLVQTNSVGLKRWNYCTNLYIIRININVIDTKIQVCGRDGPDTPISLRCECCLLVWTCCGNNKFISMHICCPCCHCS
jgi:hypothetical protein